MSRKVQGVRKVQGGRKEEREERRIEEEGVMRRKEEQGGRSNEDGEEGAAKRLEKKIELKKVVQGRIVIRSVLFRSIANDGQDRIASKFLS